MKGGKLVMSKLENKDVIEKINFMLQEVLETHQIFGVDEDLTILGLDSLKSVALIVNLEESFNIVFEDEELLLEYYSTIGKIAARVSGKLD